VKPIKWTKADAKRAEKMGWKLTSPQTPCVNGEQSWRVYHIRKHTKTDCEARSMVLYRLTRYSEDRSGPEWKTCLKAILLCMGGNS
jgi:hypothetical protein